MQFHITLFNTLHRKIQDVTDYTKTEEPTWGFATVIRATPHAKVAAELKALIRLKTSIIKCFAHNPLTAFN